MILNTITELHERGFTSDFILINDQLFCAQTQKFFGNDEFDVLEVHDLDDNYINNEQTVVYAVECPGCVRGILFERPARTSQPGILLNKISKFWK